MGKGRNTSLLRRIGALMLLFVAVLLLEAFISGYQTRRVIQPQQKRMEKIQVISRFLGNVEQTMRELEAYRWDYGESQELMDLVEGYEADCKALLPEMDMPLNAVSEEEYLLCNAAVTTYGSFSQLVGEILDLIRRGESAQAAEVYYSQGEACGRYTRQYIQELLQCSIQDSQSAYEELSDLNRSLSRIQAAVAVACAIIGVWMAASLLSLLRSVRQMAQVSRAISGGNLDISDVDEDRTDEMGQMAKAFNEMKRSMKRQMATLEENHRMQEALYKKENEALELQNLMEQEKMQKLRSQINPHFLFNTLNVILYTAQQEGAEKTQSLIGSLGSLFRYALGSNAALVPLSREVRIVDNFYTLYKVRFGSRINLRWEVSPEIDLTEVLTPSFLLQPLVENAFRHGLAPKESGGTAVIHLEPEGETLAVTVTDDGVGMTEEKLAQLRENLLRASDTGEHIGLYNVAARLRMLGPEFGLAIYSQTDIGTRVELRLPLVRESQEESDDTDTDC